MARRSVLASPVLAGESGQRRVGGDLKRLGRARVLGVLQHLLLATASANQIERGLGQRQSLPDKALQGTQSGLKRVVALPQLGQPALETLAVPPGLLEVGLKPVAVLTPGGHRNLRLQLAHERQLRTMGLVQVLHDLLLLLLSHKITLSGWTSEEGRPSLGTEIGCLIGCRRQSAALRIKGSCLLLTYPKGPAYKVRGNRHALPAP